MLSIVCGGFVYVATIGVLQLTASKKYDGNSKNKFTQITLEACGFILGVSMMVFIALYEEFNHEDGHHDHQHRHREHEHHLSHLEIIEPHVNHPGL